MSVLKTSSSPHIRSSVTTRRIMLDVIIALIPSIIASCLIFGPQSLLIIAVSVITCVLCEYISGRVMKRSTSIFDLTAVVTGILLALTLPVRIPIYVVVLGAAFSIVITKQLFGGLGHNIFNPALAGRAFMLISFAAQFSNCDSFINDAITGATPLSIGYSETVDYLQLVLGTHSGSIGETCKIAILLGFAYLLIRKVISVRIPLVMVGAVALTSLLIGREPLYEVLTGGVLFASVFMATDYVTSPVGKLGQIIYAALCGIITVLIRAFGAYPEGTMFAILIMNAATPLIDKLCRPRVFGEVACK